VSIVDSRAFFSRAFFDMEYETVPNSITGITVSMKADKSLARIVLKLDILSFESKDLLSAFSFFALIDAYPPGIMNIFFCIFTNKKSG